MQSRSFIFIVTKRARCWKIFNVILPGRNWHEWSCIKQNTVNIRTVLLESVPDSYNKISVKQAAIFTADRKRHSTKRQVAAWRKPIPSSNVNQQKRDMTCKSVSRQMFEVSSICSRMHCIGSLRHWHLCFICYRTKRKLVHKSKYIMGIFVALVSKYGWY